MNRRTLFIAGLLLSSNIYAQTEVPHDFQAGTPARAAEVNENFDALEAAIDQNATAIQSIPAGPQGDVGPQGPQGLQGIQGPAGADLSNEVNILQGEQSVQNDRIDELEDRAALTAHDANGVSLGKIYPVFSGFRATSFRFFYTLNNGYVISLEANSGGIEINTGLSTQVAFNNLSCTGPAFVLARSIGTNDPDIFGQDSARISIDPRNNDVLHTADTTLRPRESGNNWSIFVTQNGQPLCARASDWGINWIDAYASSQVIDNLTFALPLTVR
jgi:hypothetical protein